MIWLDFETRSRCDLPSRGVYNYAQDASTEVLCMSYAVDDGEVATWLPGMPFPDIAGHQIMAHNAAFERLIFWYVLCPDIGVPEPKLEQFYCTAAQARANCLPGSLEDVGRAVSSKMKKDHRGAALIRLLCIPRKDGTFNNDPAVMAEMVAYCEQDVRAMREISKSMRPLSDDELADYHASERINDRGVLVDLDLCRAAIEYAEEELLEIQAIVAEVSKGELASVRSPRMRQWVQARVGPEAVKLMWTGEKYSIDKSVRANLLILADESPDEVPADVAEVIQCADDLWASSVAKFKRLADLADPEDHRVRGAFVFAGGSATGRACVDANTLVETENGRCPIWLLKRGGKVLTHTGRLCKVTDVIYKGTETMYRVTTASGAWVDCTADHQLLTHLGWEKHEHKSSGAARSGYTVGSRAVIYDPAIFTRHRNSQNNAHDGSDGIPDITGGSAKRPAKVVAFGQSSSVKDSRKKPYVWRAEASRSDIAAGLPLSMGGGASRVCAGASVAIDGRVGYIRMADRLGSAPHRFEYTEQQPKQSSYSHVEWASNTSFAEITEIVCVGEKGVWDITVEGDASYCAQGLVHHNSSYGAQVHNFTRKTAKDPAAVRQAMVRGHKIVPAFGPRVTDVLKGMLRPALIPAPGCVLVVADWSAIEGRVNPWLSNCPAGEVKLDVFRSGRDPYVVNAMATFGVTYDAVTGDQRQVGKVQELALGFLGGEGSFDTFGRVYGVRVENVPRVIRLWRTTNPWAMKHGQDLESAYTRAMRNKGREFPAGRVVYLYDGQHLWYALPSGRVLCYPFAKLEADGVSYLKAAWKPAADATEWPRARLWRGLAVENCWSGNTRLYTSSGLKYIKDVLPSDLLWDGVSWVPHGGVVCNGEQEVVKWAGTQVTPHHQITDGRQWRNVIDLDDRTTSGCLAWGRASVPWSYSRAIASGQPYDATAGYQTTWKPVSYGVGATDAPRVANGPQQKRKKSASLKTMIFGNYGYTEEAVRSLGAMTQSIKPILTMVGGAYRSMRRGWQTSWSGCATPLRSPVGTIQNWISTALTMTGTMRQAIYVWPPAVKTPTIDGAHVFSALKDAMSPSLSFGVNIVLDGVATTPSRTTSSEVAPVMRLPHTIKQRVYDIRNCGPNHCYAVETAWGPVIAHNCTQAVANDLLRVALRRIPNTVLHCHDEVVVECSEEDGERVAAEVERVMCEPPEWAAGLPLGAEVKIMKVYGK